MNDLKTHRETLTAKLVEMLEAGTAPWQKPWDGRLPCNATTGKTYRGANTLHLCMVGLERGYADSRWATYRQAQENGWQVRKGERGTLVEYWKFPEREAAAETKNRDQGNRETPHGKGAPAVFFARVFNAQQMDNVSEPEKRMYEWDPVERAESILASSGAKILHDQFDNAFYDFECDRIHLPARGQFQNAADYYPTALHELGHWSAHPSRLNRDLGAVSGVAEYAREELRAELASWFMSDQLGIAHDPERHAAYTASWIGALKDDRNEIFRAARDAEKITGYIMSLDQGREQERERVPVRRRERDRGLSR